ncbi:MAG: DNRLRE domain-containing protein [Bacteroidales bacterium]
MKKLFTLAILFAFTGLNFAQTTIVLQPGETTSKDASIWDYAPTTNYGTHPDFAASAWTWSGTPTIGRSLIDFDLSAIPSNATIISATLSLYYHYSTNTTGHSTLSGSNACWLKRITSSWDEMTVTWNNQPSTTTQNEVVLPASINDTMDYPNIDVTNLISDIYNNPSTGYGMMLMLQTEQYYRSLLFASSGETDPAKRPKLTVTYSINTPSNDTCIYIDTCNSPAKQNPCIKDASIWDYAPTTNYGTHPDFAASAWTWSGTPTIGRSLIDFDLSAIPSNATIISATLSLYYHYSTNTTGHSTLSGSNACWLKRITSSWDEMTVTWNNQPSTTTQNEVVLPASINDTMDYPNIDVTNLISDIYNNPSTGYGMMLMLQTEQYYRSLLFASSDAPEINKKPKLEICYHFNASVPEIKILNTNSLSVYPNPATNNLIIEAPQKASIEILNLQGQLIKTLAASSNKTSVDVSAFPSGVYFIRVKTEKRVTIKKFVKE